MNFFNKLNVKQKLSLPILLSVIAILFFFYQGYTLTVDMKEQLTTIHKKDSNINKRIRDIYIKMQSLRTNIVKYSLSDNKDSTILTEANLKYKTILDDIYYLKNRPVFQTDNIQQTIKNTVTRLDSYYNILLTLPDEFKESDEDGIYALTALDSISIKVQSELTSLTQIIDTTLAKNFKEIDYVFSLKLQEGIYATIIAIIIFIIVSSLISRNIKAALEKLTNGLNSFFDYLNKRSMYVTEIELKTSDEFGQMAEILNENIAVSTRIHEEMYELNYNLEGKVARRTKELELLHNQLESSVKFSSLIQGSFIPEDKMFFKYFDEFFTIWQPRNIVGGDIYLFDELRDDNECLLMVIDCTGHGVPGAFITMIVKAIERQIIMELNKSDKEVSPAYILQHFNQYIKIMLKQDSADALSNVGFDGSILYYNRKENIVKFAGANLPLYIMQDNKLTILKGDKQSIGYKKSDLKFKFTDHVIKITQNTNLYLTTDGFIDQNGGKKDFPFGTKRFRSIIETYYDESFADQKEIFLNELAEYMLEYTISKNQTELEERNDDITLVGLKLKPQNEAKYEKLGLTTLDRNISKESIFFVNTVLTQEVVHNAVTTIEEKLTKDKGLDNKIINNLIYITIELIQNVMHASSYDLDGVHYDSKGICSIGFDNAKEKFYVATSNFMELDVSNTFKEKLEYLTVLDKSELKEYRKELRRSGEFKHKNGAGLGLVEVACKTTEEIKYYFERIDKDKNIVLFEILVYI